MSAPTAADFPTLGFVPCPGDYQIAKDTAATVRRTSDALGEICRVLEGADEGDWRGKAADAFRALLADDFRPKVKDAYSAFSTARTVLTDWAENIDRQQRAAERLENEAAELKRTADAEARKEEEEKKDGEDGKKDADAGSGSDEDPLADVRRRAHGLQDDYEQEGREAATRLKKALDIAPNEPGFWDKLGDAVGGALEAIGQAVMDPMGTLKELAPLFKTLGDIAGLLSTVTGLLALVPGLQFLGAASLALAGVALVAHYLSAVGTTGSFLKALTTKDVILDAVGFGLGKLGARFGDEILAAAKASNQPTRMVAQLGGRLPAMELPQGYFQLARGASYNMSVREFGMRTGQYFTTWTGNAFTAEGSHDTIETAGKLLTWDFGALTNKDTVAPWAR